MHQHFDVGNIKPKIQWTGMKKVQTLNYVREAYNEISSIILHRNSLHSRFSLHWQVVWSKRLQRCWRNVAIVWKKQQQMWLSLQYPINTIKATTLKYLGEFWHAFGKKSSVWDEQMEKKSKFQNAALSINQTQTNVRNKYTDTRWSQCTDRNNRSSNNITLKRK